MGHRHINWSLPYINDQLALLSQIVWHVCHLKESSLRYSHICMTFVHTVTVNGEQKLFFFKKDGMLFSRLLSILIILYPSSCLIFTIYFIIIFLWHSNIIDLEYLLKRNTAPTRSYTISIRFISLTFTLTNYSDRLIASGLILMPTVHI